MTLTSLSPSVVVKLTKEELAVAIQDYVKKILNQDVKVGTNFPTYVMGKIGEESTYVFDVEK